jgi:hypothetical protein
MTPVATALAGRIPRGRRFPALASQGAVEEDRRMHRALLVLVVAALAGPASASAAPCPSKSVVFDSPSVVVVKAKAKRERGGGKSANIVACVRATGRRRVVSADYEVPGAYNSATILGVFGRSLLVEDLGGGAESEEKIRTLVDLVTGKRTEQTYVGGTDFDGVAIASPAGLLSLSFGPSPDLVLRRPGVKDRKLATGGGLGAIALGTDTAYWRTSGPDGSPAVTQSATVPAGAAPLPPRRWRGPAESTLQRVVAEPATGPVTDLAAIGPSLLAYRFTVGDRTAVVVYDRAKRSTLHLGLLPGVPAEVAYGRGGIVATGPTGATLVSGTTVTVLGAEPATDPAISDRTGDVGVIVPPVAYWTTAAGPQSR